jgi:uncharacterized membrane protein
VSSWLKVAAGSENSVADATIRVFDLVQTSALAARKGQTLNVSSVSLGVLLPSGITKVSLRAVVTEPPQIAVGPPGQTQNGTWRTEVRSAQVRAELGLEVTTPVSIGVLASAKVTVPVFVSLAQGLGRLQSIHCPRADDAVMRVKVGTQAGLATIGIGQFSSIGSSDTVVNGALASVTALSREIARVESSRSTSSAGPSKTLDFTGPFVPRISQPTSAHTQSIGNGATAIIDAAETSLSYASNVGLSVVVLDTFPLTLTNTLILNAVRPVINAVLPNLSTVIPPILEALGARVGGADLTVLAVQAERPALIR